MTEQHEGLQTVFFIGAGFTKAIAMHAPTGNDFVAKAFHSEWDFAGDPRILKLKSFLEDIYHPLGRDEEYPRIEDVLSLLDFCLSSNQALNKKYGQEDLEEIRGIVIFVISEMIRSSVEQTPTYGGLARQFVEKVVGTGLPSVFISTNYDIILDNALLECASSCNYGLPIRKSVALSPEKNARPDRHDFTWHLQNRRGHWQGKVNTGRFPLLKIHGSLNWVYCPRCDEIDLTTADKGAARLINDNLHHFCSNQNCAAFYEPFLVTPTMQKLYASRPLKTLFRLCEQAIAEAGQIVFIGYSLPEADYHIRSMLTRGLSRRVPKKKAKILVVDKSAETEEDKRVLDALRSRYTSIFGSKARVEPIGLEGLLQSFEQKVSGEAAG